MRSSYQLLAATVLIWLVFLPTPSAHAIRPLRPNPVMLKAAPDDCTFFFHSFGFAKPDPNSSNKTEQLLADADIQEFLVECNKLGSFFIEKAMEEANSDEERAQMKYVFSMLKKLAWRPWTLYIGKLGLSEDAPTFQLGLIIDPGEFEADAKDLVLRLKQKAGEAARTTTLSGVECVEVSVEGDPPIYWAVHEGLLLLTVGEGSFGDLIAQFKTDFPSWMKPVVRRLPIEQRGMFGYLDLKRIGTLVGQVDEADLQTFWDVSGLQGVNYVSFALGLEGDGIVFRKLVSCDQMKGVLQLADNEGLGADDIARIPAGVPMAMAMRMDAAEVFDTCLEIARRVNDDAETQIAAFLQQARAMLGGLDLRDDVLASIGDKWIVYQSGGFATMMVPDLVAAVNLRDQKTATRSLDAIVKLASQAMQSGQEQGSGVSIRPKDFDGVKGYSVRGMPVALSFCIDDDELIVGLSAAAVKNHLRHQPEIEKSIAVNPRLRPVLDKYERPLLISYLDMVKSFEANYPSLKMLLNMSSGPMSQEGLDFDPSALPPLESITQYLEPSVFTISRVPDGIEVESRDVFPRVSGASAGVAVLLLLPAVNAAREAARRNGAANQSRQIVLAVINHEARTQRYPLADVNGLSWRVHILPYLDQQELYDKFNLDEPWDSEHNKTLIKEMPSVFVSPSSNAADGMASFLAVGGKDPIIVKGNRAAGIADVRDGVSKTMMIVEVDDELAVIWTKPSDFDWDENDPTGGLGGLHSGGVFIAGFADGHVMQLPKTIDKRVLSAMFTKSGGEAIDWNALAP